MASSIVDPKSVASEGLAVIKGHKDSFTDKLHVIDGCLLSEFID